MYRAVDTGLRAIDVRTLTEAAQSLGAGTRTILFEVIFPNLRVAILSGVFLTFAIVMGEFTFASLMYWDAFGPYMEEVGAMQAYTCYRGQLCVDLDPSVINALPAALLARLR
jgi:putative spermidine/putrescine transport system permease protein